MTNNITEVTHQAMCDGKPVTFTVDKKTDEIRCSAGTDCKKECPKKGTTKVGPNNR